MKFCPGPNEPVLVPRNLVSPVGPDPLYSGNDFGDPEAQVFQSRGSNAQGIQGAGDPRSNGSMIPITDPQMNSFLTPRYQEQDIRTRQDQMQEPRTAQLRRLRQERASMDTRHPGIYQLSQDRNDQLQQERQQFDRMRLSSYHGQTQALQTRLQEDQRQKLQDFREELAYKQARRHQGR